MNDYDMHYGMGFGWLILILFIAAIFYFISGNKNEDVSAKDILDKKYANGEIDEKEYKTRKENLKK
jgi:putative membrane protein